MLDLRKVFVSLDGLCDVTSRVGLNQHEFQDVNLLVVDPSLIEVVQVLRHIFDHVLHRDIGCVLNDALVQVSNDVLNNAELLEELAARVQHLVREHILLSVDPQVGKAFLGGVEDLCQVAQTSLLVEDFVRLGELLAIGSCGAVCLKYFTEALYLV